MVSADADVNESILGIDAGTTSIKAVAFSLDGVELEKGVRETPLSRPRQGWIEQDMDETWTRTAGAIREVVDAVDCDIAAIGVTGQGGGCWLIDSEGDPVRNAIVWSDSRAVDYVRRWRDSGEYDAVFDRVGYGLFPGLPLSIYRWLCDEDPGAIERTETAFFCKDWVKFRLTGVRTTDPSDVSIAHYRPDQSTFSDEVTSRLGVSELADRIPAPTPGSNIVGHITSKAAEETGLSEGTPVVSGVMDVAASAFGSGAAEPGDCSSVVGTTLQNQTLLSTPDFSPPRAGYTLALGVEGMGLRAMGAMAGTLNLDWLINELLHGEDLDAVEARARSVPLCAGGVMYHPYLSSAGEKAPFVDPSARAQFTGLSPEHTRNHLVRAVYEGVALAMRDCYEDIPGETDQVYLSGGGARSALWCQLFADCLAADIAVPVGEEFGAKGVALLAGIAIDCYANLESAVARTTDIAPSYEPRPNATQCYDRWYGVYRETRERMTSVWECRPVLDRR